MFHNKSHILSRKFVPIQIWQIGAPDEEMVVPPTRERGRGGGGGEVGQMPASAGPSLPPALERSDSDVSISSLSSMVSVATTAAGSTHDCQSEFCSLGEVLRILRELRVMHTSSRRFVATS